MTDSNEFILPFTEIRATDLPLVGRKGANLGELTHAGFPVSFLFSFNTKPDNSRITIPIPSTV
jgi:pyruvate,water dikinase